jgi:hypothetical protein
MREWSLYYLINSDADRMAMPFKRVVLCLSFFKGPKVDSWVMLQIGWLQNVTTRQHNLITPQDPRLWNIFKAEFCRAFTDTAREQNMYKKLVALKMIGGDLNTYIMDFEKLAQDAGYHLDEKGPLILFRRGLPYGLHKAVVDKVHLAPVTIDQWQQAAKQQQVAYADWRALMGDTPRAPQDCHQHWRGALDQRNNRRRDPDTMDIDTIEINSLTKDEKDEYMKKGLCFYCKGIGHVSHNYPKKKGRGQDNQQGGGSRQWNSPPVARAAQIEEQPRIEDKEVDLKELTKHFKKLRKEEQNALFEDILASKDFTNCPNPLAWARTVQARIDCISKKNQMTIKIPYTSIQKMVEICALTS